MRLSPHFTLAELTRTSHTELDNTPGPADMERLRVLCRDLLEPVRARFGPVTVHSGFRSRLLNSVIPGSAKDSAHMYGCAADFHVDSATIAQVVRWVVEESGLPFDQVIDEERGSGRWVHLGMLRPGHEERPRRQALVMRGGGYVPFPLEKERR